MEQLLNQLKVINERSLFINKLISQNKSFPCIELYEFELKGYNADGYTKYKFGHMSNATKDSCGIIEASDGEYETNRVSSCDILSSSPHSGGGRPFEYFLQNMYYEYEARGALNDELINKYYDKSQQTEILKLLQDVIKLNKKYIEKNSKPSNLILSSDTLHYDALVYKINVPNTDRIVIFGDFHGSFHTFIRHIIRLRAIGIITSLSEWTIKDGYRLVFLGDILDRGVYALEILTIICNFIKNNNTEDNLKIIYNRGNHEELSIYADYGFAYEYNKKLKDIDSKERYKIFIELFSTLPSAIIMENDNKARFWLSHGGFPVEPSNINKVIKLDGMILIISQRLQSLTGDC